MSASSKRHRSKRIIGAKYFPFPTARPGQEHFMEDISWALKEGKHLVAHAPTGIGKTVAVLTTAVTWCRAKKKKLFFLTSKQSQHSIAVDTLRKIRERMGTLSVVDIKSREKMCPYYLSEGRKLLCQSDERYDRCHLLRNDHSPVIEYLLSNILHVEEAIEIASESEVCPHKAALDAAAACDVIVCDYNYIFSSIRDLILAKLDLELEDILIIVDEAHNLPDRIRENMTMNLTPNIIENAARQCKGEYEQLGYYVKDVGQVLSDLYEDVLKGKAGGTGNRHLYRGDDPGKRGNMELSDYTDKKKPEKTVELRKSDLVARLDYLFSSTLSGDHSYTMGEFINDLDRHIKRRGSESKDDHLLHLVRFLREWMNEEGKKMRLFSGKNGPTLEIYSLDPGEVSQDIFHRASPAILMSGTLFPGAMYADILGMDPEKTIVKHYSSPFPRQNRLIVGMDVVTTRYKKREKTMFQAIANQIQEISKYANGNVAAFFPSYQLLTDIHTHLERCFLQKPILVEKRRMTKKEKRAIMEELKKLKDKGGAIMFAVQGGSLSEGVDYRENLLDGICIVGLPLQPPTVKVKGLVRYYIEKYGRSKGYYYSYIYPAINKVLQASGRAIRSYRDWVFILLMDHRFGMGMYKRTFPPDFGYVMIDDVHENIRDFLKRHT